MQKPSFMLEVCLERLLWINEYYSFYFCVLFYFICDKIFSSCFHFVKMRFKDEIDNWKKSHYVCKICYLFERSTFRTLLWINKYYLSYLFILFYFFETTSVALAFISLKCVLKIYWMEKSYITYAKSFIYLKEVLWRLLLWINKQVT